MKRANDGEIDMENRDRVEYYDGDTLLVALASSIVPPPGSKISIRGETWVVVYIAFALDYADRISERAMRANISLERN